MLRSLPNLLYNISVSPTDTKFISAKNLWRRAEILREVKSSMVIFNEYVVKNGERPEDLSTRFYKDPFLGWTILVINDIVNYYEQWPKSTRDLNEYVYAKYDNPMATKHYITTEVKDANENIICPAGKIVPSNFQISYFNGSTTVTANPVVSITNYQYESDVNAKKERIMMVRPNYIRDFVEVFQNRQNQGGTLTIGNSYSGITMD